MYKYLLLIAFFSSVCCCYSQKVLIIRKPVSGLKDGDLYFGLDSFDVRTGGWRTVINTATETDSAYVIVTRQDSLFLMTSNQRDELSTNKHQNTRSSYLLLKKIQSYPQDTIAISGISFVEYRAKRTVSAKYSWKANGDTTYSVKSLRINRVSNKPFVKTILYPRIYIRGVPVGKNVAIDRHIVHSSTNYCNPSKEGYSYVYEELFFLFVVDIGGAEK